MCAKFEIKIWEITRKVIMDHWFLCTKNKDEQMFIMTPTHGIKPIHNLWEEDKN